MTNLRKNEQPGKAVSDSPSVAAILDRFLFLDGTEKKPYEDVRIVIQGYRGALLDISQTLLKELVLESRYPGVIDWSEESHGLGRQQVLVLLAQMNNFLDDILKMHRND